jgi:hypothetical protein
MELEAKYSEVFNRVIFYKGIKDDLYLYHPSNPHQLNLEESYNEVLQKIEECEEELDEILLEIENRKE